MLPQPAPRPPAPRPAPPRVRQLARRPPLKPPTFKDVLTARREIRAHLDPTPQRHYPALSALTGTEIWVKHENFLPTGAFKVRGGVNLLSQMSERERRRGVISASPGNH